MDSLIDGCRQFLTSPHLTAWIKEQWIHLKSYEARVRELECLVQKLKKKRDVIQRTIDEEEHRRGREIHVEVEEWKDGVDKLFLKYEDFKNDRYRELAEFNLLQNGYLPKPGIRYGRRREAYAIIREANGLLQTAKFDTFSYWSGPPSMASFFSNIGYESYPSREETMTKIIEELEDPSVRMIGLHGLSGVGKTTLVKEVVKKALKDKMFDVVTMATVTKIPDIRKIQGQIADTLGVTLDEESDFARAARIQKILKNDKKSTLVILDDLWEKMDLNMLGIPYEIYNDSSQTNVKEGKSLIADSWKNYKEGKSLVADSWKNDKEGKSPTDLSMVKTEEIFSQYKGCKILMISESKQALLRQMEGKANSIFSLEVLKEKEAQMLFKKKAGIGDKNSEFENLAAQIANKCNGLPMSIVTTARALKNHSLSVWEDIHRKLEWQNLTGAPELSTKLSYDLLEDEELKYTFLLCARMGRDALIMDLVKYCIGLGFLQGIYTVRETRDRVYALVAKLKDSGLLSDGYSCDHFTMQDTVRNAALSIAYKENHLFTMSKGKIAERPDKLERYAAISLHHCDFIEGFLKKRNYGRLRVFHVNNNNPNLKIPINFFKGMKELKVLILTGIHLSLLKLSISSLTELRMLCLEQCMLDEDLSVIGKLKKLRILSFSGSDIENLPVELQELEKLQIFDISNCSKLKEIPSSVISRLVSLEDLYMRNTLIQWEVEGHAHESKKASLSELKHLNQLITLDIQIPDVSYLPKNLFFDQLDSYKIVIGDLIAYLEADFKMPEKYETSRFLAIRLKGENDSIHSLKGIKMLFERVENLFLEELNAVQDVFYRLNLKGFPYLKHLSIVNNSTIESLIHPKDREQSEHPEKAFPKLESLCLNNLKKIVNICSCKLSEPSFGKLKVIKINLCGQLKSVFLYSVVRLLSFLETIEVSECNSLKEIVHVEMQSTGEVKLMFPELRSLKLQSLAQFVGFCPIPSRKEKELFNEKVDVSKLERMELSSIPIDIIWSVHQSSQISSFKNLTHLDVNGCWKLEDLISFSMAKSLASLQSLFVSECEKVRSIFPDCPQMEGSIFPKLKNIKLSSMKSLKKIWNSEPPSDSFSNLDTLIIEECDKLVIAFPFYIEGIFHNLCNLRVTNCRSMQEIFDMHVKVGDVANLQDVHLEKLPKLKHVWKLNEDRVGILKWNNLQKIRVQNCYRLENIFPFSVANCLDNLEYLEVDRCFELTEIVAKSEAANTDEVSFHFPKLSTIKFSYLRRLTSLYAGPGAYNLSCPTLNDLSIEFCDKLEPFQKNAQRKPLFPEQVINKLKSMQIESQHANSPSSYMVKWNHRRDNLEELCLSRLKDTEILYSFLHRNPNLKSLSLNRCFFEEISPLTEIENLGVVPKLKSLKLIDLPYLKEIGFEPDIILKRVEFLILKNCRRMTTVVPSWAALSSLTNLEVVSCAKLEYLMSPSTAKSLGQLNTMKVIKCESLVEIVGKEEDGENAGKVVFKQLKALELVSLKKLRSFCSSDSCDFEFPSLEKTVVSGCYNMEIFSEKVTSSSTSVLQNIYVVHQKEKKRCCWKGDLNATIKTIHKEKKCFEGMGNMSFSEHPELEEAWKGGQFNLQVINSWFCSLKILKMQKCEIQPCAIPSNILPYLKSLEELEVRDCKNVEIIFEMEDTWDAGSTTFQLQKLYLEKLPKLMQVWKGNGKETHSFQNLQAVLVAGSQRMRNVFPAAVAKNLKKLRSLVIRSCRRLLEIVRKEEDAEAAAVAEFVFPCLTTLHLSKLPELICFYPEPFTLGCPVLDQLNVVDCSKLELFESADRQPVFLDLKVISNLESLTLEWKHSLVLNSRLLELEDGPELEYLIHIGLLFDVDENENPNLPIQILQKLRPNLKTMRISSCRFLEVFRTQISEINRLNTLWLTDVWKLKSIGSGDAPWLDMICTKLHRLFVVDCPHFTALLHSTSSVSFSYLKELCIFNCQRLKYLFTSSAAKALTELEQIQVSDCKSIKEIVAKEQDETASGEIKLQKLYHIYLYKLSSLECFYSGNQTLQLPSLIQVYIDKCPKMETFTQGSIAPNSCREITTWADPNDRWIVFHDDLNNSSVKKVFLHQNHIVFGGDSHMLQEIRNSETLPVPDWYFCNLTSMVVEGCGFLTDGILPSHLLHFLSNLKKLQVRKCNSLKAIFSMGPQGSLSHLEQLQVENCDELVAIVANDEADNEEPNKKIAMFSSITSLRISDLPKLNCIYHGKHILEWRMLKELHVKHCQKLKFFASEFQNSPDLNPDGEDRFSADQQAIVSVEKVTPCLEVMSLGMEEAMMIEQGKLDIDLPKLTSLKLQCFHDDQGDIFPCVFGLKVSVSLPTIEKFVLLHSAFKEIFPSEIPSNDIDYDKILSQLKRLELLSLFQLKSIGLEHSWISPFIQNLKTLLVRDCHCLATLSPSTVSFSNLIKLIVKNCHGLKYLFTLSTAKTLVVLKEVYITKCKSLKTIVAKDGEEGGDDEDNDVEEEGQGEGNEDEDEDEDEDDVEDEDDAKGDEDENENEDNNDEDGNQGEDDVTFKKLESLTLSSLPKLRSFYTGSSSLNFPCLKVMSFSKPCSTNLFRHIDNVPKQVRVKIDGIYSKRDINSVIMQQDEAEAS